MSGQVTKDKQQHTHKNGGFHSSLGFVLACVGSAVGMGNIWMFPYRVGQYGGAAFLIPYLIFVAIFGTVGLSAEFAIGRRAGTGTLGAYKYWLDSTDGISGNCHRLFHHCGMGSAFPVEFLKR